MERTEGGGGRSGEGAGGGREEALRTAVLLPSEEAEKQLVRGRERGGVHAGHGEE